MPPIRIAILGSGIFARDAHLPAIQALGDTYEIAAIYSRNPQTAAELASKLPGAVQTYTELEHLLVRTDIDAVDVILPIAAQPAVVEKALQAGKHVLSEKPVAPDVKTGRELLKNAHKYTNQTGVNWMVAENIRFEPAYQQAGTAIRHGEIGKPVQFIWTTAWIVDEQNKYYHTAWRRNNSVPGGLILDAGVHSIAAMRAVMGEIESVSAYVAQVNPNLPPADTFSATFKFASGALGTWTHTFVTDSPWTNDSMQILGERGAMQVNTKRIDIKGRTNSTIEPVQVHAIQEELAAFARVIHGELSRSTPEQALQDVAVIQAILESAETGRAVKPERIV